MIWGISASVEEEGGEGFSRCFGWDWGDFGEGDLRGSSMIVVVCGGDRRDMDVIIFEEGVTK